MKEKRLSKKSKLCMIVLLERSRGLRVISFDFSQEYKFGEIKKICVILYIIDAANVCLRKMNAATALINGLGGEKTRWTMQSKEFKQQLGRLVGDVLLATGFLSYCGQFLQHFIINFSYTLTFSK